MLSQIKFSDELSIYTTKILDIDNEQLSNDLELNCHITLFPPVKVDKLPGIQSDIIITTECIQKLEVKIIKILKNFLNLDNNSALYKRYWVFISDSDNDITAWHNHIEGRNIIHSKEIPQWTFVYYVSFPDNLKENDGLLFFKTKSGQEFSIMPEENQIIVFPADVLHRPGLNRESTKKRIVFGGNISLLNRNKKYYKNEKTLL